MTFAGRDNETTCVKSLVIILEVYFLLNLEHPRRAKAAYEKLQKLICAAKQIKNFGAQTKDPSPPSRNLISDKDDTIRAKLANRRD